MFSPKLLLTTSVQAIVWVRSRSDELLTSRYSTVHNTTYHNRAPLYSKVGVVDQHLEALLQVEVDLAAVHPLEVLLVEQQADALGALVEDDAPVAQAQELPPRKRASPAW